MGCHPLVTLRPVAESQYGYGGHATSSVSLLRFDNPVFYDEGEISGISALASQERLLKREQADGLSGPLDEESPLKPFKGCYDGIAAKACICSQILDCNGGLCGNLMVYYPVQVFLTHTYLFF